MAANYYVTKERLQYFANKMKDFIANAISGNIDATLNTTGKSADAKATGDALATKVDKITGKSLSTEDYTTAEKTKLSGIANNATATIIDSSLSVTGQAADAAAVNTALATKVDKVTGKGLSTNDFTTEEKTKLARITANATNTIIDDTLTQTGQAADAKATGDSLSGKVDKITGKSLSTEDYTTEEKTKLSGIAVGATKVEIDTTLSTTGKAADAKTVGDALDTKADATITETALSGKVDKVTGKGLSTNDYSDAEKQKLNGIATGATKVEIDTNLETAGKAADAKVVGDTLATKVDKISGKVLSTNDFTDALKNKLDGISNGATNITIDSTLTQTGEAADAKATGDALADKVDKITGKGLSTEDYTTAEKTKLSGIASGATNVVIDNTVSITGQAADAGAVRTALNSKISDVTVNSTSVVSNGVADIPLADDTDPGVVKVAERYGLRMDEDGSIKIYAASDAVIKQASNSYRPVGASHIDVATFYGLAKAAGDTTQISSNNTVGTYTDSAKGKILTMLGAEDFLAPIEIGSTSTRDYNIGDIFVLGSTLQQATAPIVIGEAFSASNHESITVASVFVKKSDAVSSSAVSSIWTGTQAEYDLLTPDANTLYLIEEV